MSERGMGKRKVSVVSFNKMLTCRSVCPRTGATMRSRAHRLEKRPELDDDRVALLHMGSPDAAAFCLLAALGIGERLRGHILAVSVQQFHASTHCFRSLFRRIQILEVGAENIASEHVVVAQ